MALTQRTIAALLLIALTGVSLQSSVDACATAQFYYGVSPAPYNCGSFYIQAVLPPSSRTWNSNQNFQDAGLVDAGSAQDWSVCSNVWVSIGGGSLSQSVYATVTSYTLTTLRFSFSPMTLSAGSYMLQFECGGGGAIQLLNYYTVSECGANAPSVVNSVSVSPTPTFLYTNPITVTMSGSNILQCDQTYTATVGGTRVFPTSSTMTQLVFSLPSKPVGSYPIVLTWTNLWPGTTALGNLTISPPAVTNSLTNRYFSWNTFNASAGGILSVYGSHFGSSCANSGGLFLRSTTSPTTTIPCLSVESLGSDSVARFLVPPSPGNIVGYNDTYAVVAGAIGNMILYPTVPIVYGFGNTDHYEQIQFNIAWTGPWSGTTMSPVRLTRNGAVVTLSYLAYPFNGGSYSAAATIQSTSAFPARFRPAVTKKRCFAYIRYSGAGYELHMDIGSNGLIATYKDSTGSAFTSSPNIYPSTCVWDVLPGAY